ncbi:FAD-containing oxidoreductase [Xanthomonas campestris]|uniref:FAD-containing oxidoreductase n=1 Tax=Xanthomonas campestris TaxID=339 RepID=UPI00236580DA|nr:FAD-containing oxidoreductase [Xanthomonas campestris]MEA9726982.1 FAD-containing oxidoreductase [Xanthomonas campestris pv. raphani]WDJ05894.1 FAD-containing oxidoreductase [Xanthomonas campestris pv. incanae]
MTATRYDAIVVGAGQAGPSLAVRLAERGQRVAVIERHLVGGTCVNTGCMPTKTLVASARVAHLARRAADYGVRIAGPVEVDLPQVMARAHAISDAARTGVEQWLAQTPGVQLIRGHARFVAPDRLRVGAQELSAPRIFLNVGGRARTPELPGLDQISPLNNTSILQLRTLPQHLVVIGGSYIGLEFAQIFRRLGAQVTVVEQHAHLIGREDADISEAIAQMLQDEGIAVRTDARCIAFTAHADGAAVQLECAQGAPQIVASHVLLALGRQPNTDDLGLEAAGIATDAQGYVQVDMQLATNVPGVWAMGDCNGRGAFTHTAYNDYEILAANLLDGAERRLSQRVPAYALFTDPPLGRVGMSETQARASGRPLLVAHRPMQQVVRARENGETIGMMKLVADAQTRRVLGAAILGLHGDEAIHGIIDLINADQPIDTLEWAVPIHPTVSELWPTLARALAPAQ